MSTEQLALKVQDVPDKGKGVIAMLPISAGELVLLEAPLFTLSSDYSNSDVLAKLVALTESEQRQFLSLSNCHRGRFPPLMGICKTNALPCGDNTTIGATRAARAGIFMTGSRFNSSCVPNVNNYWDDIQQKISFRALRDIPVGEELCICYCELFASREDRQHKTSTAFGFACVCSACTLPDREQKASDKRRTSIGRLYGEVGDCGNQPSLGLRKVKLVIKLLKEEGILECAGATFYYDGFQFCVSSSDQRNAKLWIKKALDAESLGRGPETSDAKRYRGYLENPRGHPAFGLLRRQTLTGPEN
ncbi:SET domain-containing protein [Daedalea quercina L-15889]|uniref:SET domain-containing protein n=1 Tax=Daedalea quercina L-15889 TaxID=1314783 RepID=A0A165QX76_9APHY|nr:SET domain-containing protein [Daedalea quercina L-15889]